LRRRMSRLPTPPGWKVQATADELPGLPLRAIARRISTAEFVRFHATWPMNALQTLLRIGTVAGFASGVDRGRLCVRRRPFDHRRQQGSGIGSRFPESWAERIEPVSDVNLL
jgi:hypothetical protein